MLKNKTSKLTTTIEVIPFFENLPELLRPDVAASALGLSVTTIYDWHHRWRIKKIPPTIFLKINRLLYVRRDELRKWIASHNPSRM